LILACGQHPSNFLRVYTIPDDPKPPVAFRICVYPRIRASGSGSDDDLAVYPAAVDPAAADRTPMMEMDFYYVAGCSALVGVTNSNGPPDLDWALPFTDKLFAELSSTSGIPAANLVVFTLDFKARAMYKSQISGDATTRSTDDSVVFRCLKSAKEKAINSNGNGAGSVVLEVANVIDGLSAAVISHCEIRGIRATSFVLYGSSESGGSNIATYHASLQAVDIWKSTFLRQEIESSVQRKLRDLLRRNAQSASTIYG